MRRVLLVPLLLPVLGVMPLQAQRQVCDLVETGVDIVRTPVPGGLIVTIGGGGARVRFRCTGGVTLSSNQAVQYTHLAELRFTGDVQYRDSTQAIDADRFTRYSREDRSLASGNVVFRDLVSGSVIEGREMERFARTFPAGEERTVVRGRPHAVLRQAGEAADTTPPLEVDADSMIIRGRDSFRALGQVAFRRGDLDGVGVEASFEQEGGALQVLGSAATGGEGEPRLARLEAERFELTAARIDGTLEGDELRDLLAQGEALLTGEDAVIDAPVVHAFLEGGALQRLVAMTGVARAAPGADTAARAGPGRILLPDTIVPEVTRRLEPAEPLPQQLAIEPDPDARVVAVARDLRIVSDSLEILAPAERIERLVAVGRALGERIDTTRAAAPEVLASDWIRGDTIVGWFGDAQTAVPADTAERVLERLEATGVAEPATSLYRTAPADTAPSAEGEETVNYLRARRIVMVLRNGEVASVDAGGVVTGLYLTRQVRPVADAAEAEAPEAGGEAPPPPPPPAPDPAPAGVR